MDEDGEVPIGELGTVMGGMTRIGRMTTIEIEAVRANDGNRAESKWIRDSINQVTMQRSGSKAIEHNYNFYKKHADQLRPAARQ